MAVSVDTVYQRVLALANKEQRGYITPQEFNLFADQAQMEIFEQYFYDLNQFKRRPGNDTKYADLGDLIEEKMSIFKAITEISNEQLLSALPDFYRLGRVWSTDYSVDPDKRDQVIVEKTTLENVVVEALGPLTKSTNRRPVYRIDTNMIRINPAVNPTGPYFCSYVKKPIKPSWGYVVVNDKPLYNSNASTDFELHSSEESELVYRTLAYAGIAIEKPQLTQTAMGLEGAKVQQEKQ